MALRNLIPWKKEDKTIQEKNRSLVVDPMVSMNEWMENFFEDPLFGLEGKGTGQFSPKADLYESEKEFTVCVDLPGMEIENIDVVFQNNTLTIQGTKEESSEERKKQYYWAERRSGSFRRSFALPDGIDESKIQADFKNGVLKVHLPKDESKIQKHKKITIQKK